MASKKQWLTLHQKDPFVKKAKKEKFCSRAAYKLIEIQEKYHFIKRGMTVLELGAAPGGWTQVLQRYVGTEGKIIALDRLPLGMSVKAEFICGDITDEKVLTALHHTLKNKLADVILSDISPNLSGQKAIDQPRMLHLLEVAFSIAQQFLAPGGSFLFKLFQGSGSDAFVNDLRAYFTTIKRCKPAASRATSREIYILATGFNATTKS